MCEIVVYADTIAADLIVIGSRGRAHLRGAARQRLAGRAARVAAARPRRQGCRRSCRGGGGKLRGTALAGAPPGVEQPGWRRRPPADFDQIAALEPAEALAELASTRDGLAADEAAARLAAVGPNELARASRTWTSVLAAQLRSPLLGLLLVAAAVSIALGEHVEGGIIVAIMGLSVGLGFFNEFRSEQTLASLRERTGRRATVVRGGRPLEVPAAEIVPGDLCLLQIGDVVPADLRLLEAAELTIDEAALTGEPYPAEKQAAPGGGAGGIQANCAYLGTIVRAGADSASSPHGREDAARRRRRRARRAPAADRLPARPDSFAGLLAKVTAVLTVFDLRRQRRPRPPGARLAAVLARDRGRADAAAPACDRHRQPLDRCAADGARSPCSSSGSSRSRTSATPTCSSPTRPAR